MSGVAAGSTDRDQDFRVVVISGPSGSGKTTVVSRLLAESPVPLVKSVSATTRPPRSGEVDGRDYRFLTPEEFAARRERGEFLEYAEVHGRDCWYGTLKSEIERARAAGAWILLEIDVQGAMNVINEYPDAITIFLTTPSEGTYEERLRARGTESEETIRRRLQTARDELKLAPRYRYRVENDDLDLAVRDIIHILRNEKEQGETPIHA